MASGEMLQKFTHGRLPTALRLAFYPAFESAEEKRFQALTRNAEDARNSGDLAKAEKLYSTAMAEARRSSNSSQVRHGLALVYQAQRKYREAERIYRDQLEVALNAPQSNTMIHGAHMSLARLYQDEDRFVEAEEHYKAAMAETEKTNWWPGREALAFTSMWLARFYVAQHRFDDAEVLFKLALEIYEEDRSSNSYLPHHLHEFAKLCEAREKYASAEQLYRRALKILEHSRGTHDFSTVRALDRLARFCKERGRYVEAERLCRRSLATVEENVRFQTGILSRGWRRWLKRKDLEANLSRIQIPVSTALDRLAEVCELQQNYAEAEPLRKCSLEIKERAWGQFRARFLFDSLAAYANVLHKIGREPEAARFDKRVDELRTKYPQGPVRCIVRTTTRIPERNLRWRLFMFKNAILHPSRVQSNSH